MLYEKNCHSHPSNQVWIPGQGVRIDFAAIIKILIQQLDNERGFHNFLNLTALSIFVP